MFHMSIRPRDGVIVRNHLQNGQWGMEERYGPCRIRKNETFEIIILAELQHYKIAVNGHHLGVFRHRLPLNLVQFINVSGDVSVEHILLEQDTRSAQEQIIMSQVAIPSMNIPVRMQIQTPMQVHHNHPPPPYYAQQPPHSVRIFHENFKMRFKYDLSSRSQELAQ
jgi:Galactoside-binding lectin